ncbi:MAG TPA: Zn-ribbon domain-containing OB-fold protein [Azospirillum sp.]|nr:Zn-ribbon domain-containing OB-fold protein [Azospirillum sp.]
MTASAASKRPVPRPNSYVNTEAYWDGAKQHKLLLQYCPKSGRYQHYPRPVSVYTGARDLEWREAKGTGEVYTYTVIRTKVPGFEDRTPFIVANVQLDEGVRILANLLNVAPEQARIGMRVRLVWEDIDGTPYPAFEPDR